MQGIVRAAHCDNFNMFDIIVTLLLEFHTTASQLVGQSVRISKGNQVLERLYKALSSFELIDWLENFAIEKLKTCVNCTN